MTEATLEIGEFHPMAPEAFQYINATITPMDVEALASCSLSGNRTAEICSSTYERMRTGQSVSDRYILGLAWFIKTLRDQDNMLVTMAPDADPYSGQFEE
jgi:hypothetical protein